MNEQVWYDKAKVSQPGSVILTKWREQRQSVRNNATETDLTFAELSKYIGAGSIPMGTRAVDEHTAMTVSAVYACVALITGAIASLPLHVYQRTEDGRDRAQHEYWWLFNESPNPQMSAAAFWEYLISAYLLEGDGFAELKRPSFGSSRVIGVVPHHPRRVSPFIDATTGRLLYRIQPRLGGQYVLDSADMLHIPGLGFDGLRSCSPILHAARQAIGTALAANEYSSSFFTNSARPDFALVPKGKVTPDQVDILRQTWMNVYGGATKAHLPAILPVGIGVEQLTMTNEDSQLLATRTFQIEEIARIFGVPPFMIGQTEKTTSWGSGVENMGRGFVKFTLQRHLIKFEQEINRKLWPNREKYFVEFKVEGLERGDLKSENEAHRIALGRAGEPGWMTPNEVRRIKNMPPIEGGDTLITGVTHDTTSQTAGGEPGETSASE